MDTTSSAEAARQQCGSFLAPALSSVSCSGGPPSFCLRLPRLLKEAAAAAAAHPSAAVLTLTDEVGFLKAPKRRGKKSASARTPATRGPAASYKYTEPSINEEETRGHDNGIHKMANGLLWFCIPDLVSRCHCPGMTNDHTLL